MIHHSITYGNLVTRHEYYKDEVLRYPDDSFRRKPEYVCYEYSERKPKNIKKKIPLWSFQMINDGPQTFIMLKDENDIQTDDVLDLFELDLNGTTLTGRNNRCRVTCVIRNEYVEGLKAGYCIVGLEVVGEDIRPCPYK